MKTILKFLIEDGSPLYERHGYRLADSEYVPLWGGTGFIVLSKGEVGLRFWLDRDRLFLDVRAESSESEDDWFSFDLVRQMLTGETGGWLMDAESARFLDAHIVEVEALFSAGRLDQTERELRRLGSERAVRLFGE